MLLADRVSVRVVVGTLSCDATRFERDLRAGRVDAARALYRGELLPGFYDDWIDEERLRLAALHEPAGPRRRRPCRREPPQCRATSTARVSLPTYLTRMFGAGEQGARLRGLVLAHRLVTLIGPGGAGKTRMAIEMAHSLRNDAPGRCRRRRPLEPFDLIVFVPLAACTTRAQTCDALTGALQIAPGAADPVLAVVDALAGRRALLLLDNFEQLVGEALDLVARLVGLLPALHLVVTSRRALGLDGEREFAVAALELPAVDADVGAAAAQSGGRPVRRARAGGAGRFPYRRAQRRDPGRSWSGRSKACRWRSSWRRRGSAASRRPRCWSGCAAAARRASTCCREPARAARSTPGTRRCRESSSGAGSSSALGRRGPCRRSPSFRQASPLLLRPRWSAASRSMPA